MSEVWFTLHGSDDWPEGLAEGAAGALRTEGLVATRVFQMPSSGPGIVFFTQLDSSLLDCVRTASRDGRDRVIGVPLSSAAPQEQAAWQVLNAGASDVVLWTEGGGAAARHIASRFRRWRAVDEIVRSPVVESNLVGKGRAWTSTLRNIVEAAHFTAAPILLLGESGTGKELAARLVHTLDPRPNKKELIVLDCTTIVPELSGSEFFGHERGSFTGAAGARDGAFALADGGTLFLDEVGELPLGLQAQLLRVVQERTYKPVGGNTWHKTDFRLVCATNRDLAAEVARGTFRRDLYYRLASSVCRLPPLRERQEDILPLVRHFMRAEAPEREPPALDPDLRSYVLHREYPGNVRDLRQLVSRILQRHAGGGVVTVGDLPSDERPAAGRTEDWKNGSFEDAVRKALSVGAHLKDIGKAAEDVAVRLAVTHEEGNLQRAATRLGVTDRALQLRRSAGRLAD